MLTCFTQDFEAKTQSIAGTSWLQYGNPDNNNMHSLTKRIRLAEVHVVIVLLYIFHFS